MAYFSLTEIKDFLNVTDSTESSYIELCIGLIEEKLQQAGIVFNASDAAGTSQLYLNKEVEYSLVMLPYHYVLTSIILKNETDGTTIKTLSSTDYRRKTHVLSPNPVYGIELVEPICYPAYLDITGKAGFAAASPASLQIAVIELCGRLLANYKQGKQNINSSGSVIASKKIGDVETRFDNSVSNTATLSSESIIDSDPEFNSIINQYKHPRI
jgi:hypothetical protein